MNKMQQKFEIKPRPENDEREHQWADFNKQRIVRNTKDTTDNVEFWLFEPESPHTYQLSHNNEMPPGYDIDHQRGYVGKFREIYMAGTKDVTDNPTSADLHRGFVLGKMAPTDDQYTDEHKDDFYDSVEVDGVEGFVERANYLDRM